MRSHLSSMAIAMVSVAGAVTLGPRDIPNEIIYMSNCDTKGVLSSEMSYYKDYTNSRAGQQPEDIAVLNNLGTVVWEAPVGGNFKSGVSFTAKGLDINKNPGEQCGSGSNGFASFTCFREQDVLLYRDGDKTCNKIYSCSHSNHVEWTQTQASLSSDIVKIKDGHSGTDAFNTIFSVISGNHCSDAPQDIGGKCHISFTCQAPSDEILAAMANYLVQAVGPPIHPETVVTPPTCSGSIACLREALTPCCSQKVDQVASFPSTGKIDVFNRFADDPTHPSLQASLSYQVTCPAPPKCDLAICGFFAGAIGAIPGFGILGLIGAAVCLDCR
ncbi:uncharacterized protein BP5553_08037 [Venustampulla echinocandica]|uniref:Uncharacterized protein n=1 Tax=Venustampulla echinocandica TaxID=2656787 RepID=A0A370TFJ5_9HELO|nr:uncharacterized protein BP5553_08037 [Venustampulla echinocandica]RDL33669.1 hypothetical protein BP5553_08037 [Venustampulla echinocandica]